MKLPQSPLERMVAAYDPHRGQSFDSVLLAYRHNKLFAYACSGRHAARIAIDVTNDELERMQGELLSHKIDVAKVAIAIDPKSYRMLRKNRVGIALEVTGSETCIVRAFNEPTLIQGRIVDASRNVDWLEAGIASEIGRPEIGKLSFNPDLAVDCRDALSPDKDGITFEVPMSASQPWHAREGANIVMVMPMEPCELPGVDKAIELASNASFNPSSTTVAELSAAILKLFGQSIPLPVDLEPRREDRSEQNGG